LGLCKAYFVIAGVLRSPRSLHSLATTAFFNVVCSTATVRPSASRLVGYAPMLRRLLKSAALLRTPLSGRLCVPSFQMVCPYLILLRSSFATQKILNTTFLSSLTVSLYGINHYFVKSFYRVCHLKIKSALFLRGLKIKSALPEGRVIG